MATHSTAKAVTQPQLPKYFEEGAEMAEDEDRFIEFKGHRSLTKEEIPPACLRPSPAKSSAAQAGQDPQRSFKKGTFPGRQSRQPVSKTINAFLNSGRGAVVYLGITDEGIVGGIKLTHYQKDHVIQSLTDLMKKYTPCVPKNRWSVTFIPCLRKGLTEEEIQTCLDYKEVVDKSLSKREHRLRTYQSCWCDIDAEALLSHGVIPPSYVIAISINPWVPLDKPLPDTGSLPTVDDMIPYIQPIFQNEDGDSYVRGQASVIPLTQQKIFSMTLAKVHDFFAD